MFFIFQHETIFHISDILTYLTYLSDSASRNSESYAKSVYNDGGQQKTVKPGGAEVLQAVKNICHGHVFLTRRAAQVETSNIGDPPAQPGSPPLSIAPMHRFITIRL